MVGQTERRRVDDDDRAPNGREWELFVRDGNENPMRHVGSVRAADADDAHDLATRLFAWHADDVWVCPSSAMTRYTTHDLVEDAPSVGSEGDSEEPRSREWS